MSRFQLFGFILQTQIGIGLLAFPYELHKASGVDGWISLLLAGGIIQLLLLAYIALCGRFPNRNLFEFAPLLSANGSEIWSRSYMSFILH
jgi:amino acid permease